MKFLLVILLFFGSINGQVFTLIGMESDSTAVVDQVPIDQLDVTPEELFLKNISDEALKKDEQRRKIYKRIALVATVYVIIKTAKKINDFF